MTDRVQKSKFIIRQMDCLSEEQMIRMKLAGFDRVRRLEFDIPARTLEVFYTGDVLPIQQAISELDLQDELQDTSASDLPLLNSGPVRQKSILWSVLGINFTLFIAEMLAGWISNSLGLIADSLDMLADSIVYGLSLMAVGAAASRQKQVAKISGYFQISLAILGFSEVVRRFFGEGDTPLFRWMILVSCVALLGNVVSLWLITKARSKEAHMQASAIFTSNDIIVNGGVILAGLLVYWLESKWPDLVVGAIVFAVVFRGATRILKLAN